jgi:hypothetical protein
LFIHSVIVRIILKIALMSVAELAFLMTVMFAEPQNTSKNLV